MTAKKPPTIREVCGSQRGYNAHNRHDEKQCPSCRQAQTDYTRELRHRTGFSKSTLYTPAEIEAIRQQAIDNALRQFHTIHMTRRASRIKNRRQVTR